MTNEDDSNTNKNKYMTKEIEKLLGLECTYLYDNIDMKKILNNFKHKIEKYKGKFIGLTKNGLFMIMEENGKCHASSLVYLTFDLKSGENE